MKLNEVALTKISVLIYNLPDELEEKENLCSVPPVAPTQLFLKDTVPSPYPVKSEICFISPFVLSVIERLI